MKYKLTISQQINYKLDEKWMNSTYDDVGDGVGQCLHPWWHHCCYFTWTHVVYYSSISIRNFVISKVTHAHF
jgi:hypothetical protein